VAARSRSSNVRSLFVINNNSLMRHRNEQTKNSSMVLPSSGKLWDMVGIRGRHSHRYSGAASIY